MQQQQPHYGNTAAQPSPYGQPQGTDQPYYDSQQQQQQQQQPFYNSQQQLPVVVGHPQGGAGGANAQRVPLGVGGLPHATPRFGLDAEDGIRHAGWCCSHGPGPNIPLHWYDGGQGWVTKYFYDYIVRDPKIYEPGKFRCQLPVANGQLCNHEVSETDCCSGNCCWMSCHTAHQQMAAHVISQHGQQPPPRRQWASDLCDTEGCREAFFCAPCQGSRQMMALAGWEDKFHWGWCLVFMFLGCRSDNHGGRDDVYWIPPWVYVALLTRFRMVALNNIDEGFCKTLLTSCCCSICSVCQTYRELSASGVWTGSTCGSLRPSNYASIISNPQQDGKTMM